MLYGVRLSLSDLTKPPLRFDCTQPLSYLALTAAQPQSRPPHAGGAHALARWAM